MTASRARAAVGVTLAVVLALGAPSARAMSVLPLDLAELAAEAGNIFVGRVERVDTGRDERGLPAVWTTFAVAESLKGGTAAHVTLKQLGAGFADAAGGVATRGGLLRYAVGESVVLFVHPASTLGFTSPVGLGQGCFRIRERDGARVVENDVGNRNLEAGAGTRSAAPAPATGGPVPLDVFLDRVRALVATRP